MRYLIIFFFSIFSFAQQTTKVDFIKCDATVFPNFETKSIEGTIEYDFKVLHPIDTIRIDAKKMIFSDIMINGKSVNCKNNEKELLLFDGFKKGKNKLKFSYKATPKQALYFIGQEENFQIWTQGQGKYTSHWFPSFDDVNEKVIFNLNIVFDNEYQVISNGKLEKKNLENKAVKSWSFKMQKPMSSYLLMLAIGKYIKQEQTSNSGIPLEFYLNRNEKDKFDPTFRYSKQIFDYLEKEIGVKYPWKIYRQVPVRDFLYAGMENTTSTIFAQDFVVDSIGFNDRNYIWINAHELAHQWFGDMVTAKSGKHQWLQEGFAKYYEMLAEKEIFGEDYFYNKLYNNALKIKNVAKTDTIPIMNEKASSLSYYEKGAWALHFIKESIGEKKFKIAVKHYLTKYKFKNVETDDFLAEIKKVSNFDTENFKKVWLEDYKYPANDINNLLLKNKFIQDLVQLQRSRNIPFEDKEEKFKTILKSDDFYPLKAEVVYQLKDIPFEKAAYLYDLAMKTNAIQVRQAIAQTLDKIPLEFKSQYESLLDDKSYQTKEIAFSTLWNNFPKNQSNYLTKAQNWVGNNDKSLRILYLTYAQLSKDLTDEMKSSLYNELVSYTSSNYESSIRQNAFDTIITINPMDEVALKNLVNATTHFKWQFNKYAKEQLKIVVKNPQIKEKLLKLLPELNESEQFQLKRVLQD